MITPLFSESIQSINISIDPIDNTAYKLDSILPTVQRDMHIFDIRINGNLGLPLSTFIFDLDEPPLYLYDSLRTRSAFHYIKGDYGFHDLGIKTQSLTLNKGTLTGFAHTRSYSGVNGFIGEGSLVQNYLLNYTNSYEKSSFSITTAYHYEDMDLPINDFSYISKINESYFSGISYSHQSNLGEFKYFSDLQVSETEFETNQHEDWIYTQRAGFKFNLISKFTPFIGWMESEMNKYIFRLGSYWDDSLSQGSLNLAYINSPQIELAFSKNFASGYIHIERKILDDYLDSTRIYILNSLTLAVMNNSFNIKIAPSVISVNSFLFSSYRLSAGYDNRIVNFNVGGSFYDANDFALKHVINTNLQINFPYFDRYTPYLKSEYNSYYFGESISTDLLIESRLAEVHFSDVKKQVHFLNSEFGFNLESFAVSYHYSNILGEDGRFTYNYEKVPMHKYLKVAWRFKN